MIGLHAISDMEKSAEIGYWIAEKASGQGLVTKSCRRIIDHAFGEMGLNRISIKCATENIKSRAIPERLGFIREGIEREAALLHGKFYDLVVYSLLAREWAAMERG